MAEVLGNTAASYSEGAAIPAAGSTTNVLGTFSWDEAISVCSVSDHLKRAAGGSGLDAELGLSRQILQSTKELNKYVENSIVTSLISQIDSAGTWGGQSRSTYTNLASVEVVSTGSLTLEDMSSVMASAGVVGAKFDMILMSPANLETYKRLAVNPFGQSANPFLVPGNGGTIDLGFSGASYAGIPIVSHPQMPNSDVLFLNRADVQVFEHGGLVVRQHADMNIVRDVADVTYAFGLVCKRPDLCGKISNIS
jgi:hypothetical protein